MIYLDNAATTQMDERVLDAMMPYLTTEYGNAGTLYKFGRAANEAVQKARAQVAALINAEPEQVIFTSGGSEANNLVFHGLKDYLKSVGKTHILVSAVEHDSVLRAAESLIKDGFHVEYIPVSSECRVSPAVIEDALRADTGLVSVMFANNETGAINPIEDIGTICMKRGILFHTDCVQAAGCYPIDVVKIGCDFLSVSSHKIHGCKGIGALYAKDKSKLTPIVYGGSEQEFGLRGGTENVAGIVGFGKACEISSKSLHEDTVWVSTLKQRFFMALNEALKDTGDESCVHVNGMSILTPGKTINLRMDGVDGETLLLMLDGKGVCVSAGSACRSHEAEPSHVLSAMGLSKDEARSSIRISFSKKNTADEAVRAAQILAGCISALRAREEKLSQARREEHILNSMKGAVKSFESRYTIFENGSIVLYTDESPREDLDREIFADIQLKKYPVREFNSVINDLTNVIGTYEKLNHRNHKKDDEHLNKHAMHLIRLYLLCLDILEKEDIVTYRGDDLPLLMSIRKGDYQLEDGTYRPEFFEMVSDFEKRLNYAKQNTSLPDNPDMKKVEEFVMSVNRRAIDA